MVVPFKNPLSCDCILSASLAFPHPGHTKQQCFFFYLCRFSSSKSKNKQKETTERTKNKHKSRKGCSTSHIMDNNITLHLVSELLVISLHEEHWYKQKNMIHTVCRLFVF